MLITLIKRKTNFAQILTVEIKYKWFVWLRLKQQFHLCLELKISSESIKCWHECDSFNGLNIKKIIASRFKTWSKSSMAQSKWRIC